MNRKKSYRMGNNLRHMTGLIWRQSRISYLAFAVLALAGVFMPLGSLLLPQVAVSAAAKGWPVWQLISWIAGITVIMGLLSYLRGVFETKSEAWRQDIRLYLLGQVNRISLHCDYDKLENSDFQTRLSTVRWYQLTNSDETCSGGLYASIRDFVRYGLGVLVFGGILVWLNPFLGLALVVLSVLAALAQRRARLFEDRSWEKWNVTDQKIYYMMGEMSDNATGKDVRMYGAADWLNRKFGGLVKTRLLWLKRVLRRRFGADVISAVLGLCREGLAVVWLIYAVLGGHIDATNFILYFGAVTQVSLFVNFFVAIFGKLQVSSGHYTRMRSMLTEGKPARNRNVVCGPKTNLRMAPAIDLNGVCFSYGENKVLRNIDLEIKPGEKIALVGQNGAGKTTLVKLLCGLYQPTAGTVAVNGVPTANWDREALYRQYAAVFQDFAVLPFSVAENVALGEEVDRGRVKWCLEMADGGDRLADIDQNLMRAAHPDATELSGGEMQKLMLARALYKDAPILVLDEPTAALDPIAEKNLYEEYGDFAEGKTSIFISHRLASTRFCDRILFMKDGRIAEQGTHEELLALDGAYAAMFRVQSKYYQRGVSRVAQ